MPSSFFTAPSWSSTSLRSRSTFWACSGSCQKFGCEVFCSRAARRLRFSEASKIAPHKIEAFLQLFVAMFEIFENHSVSSVIAVVVRQALEPSGQSEKKATPARTAKLPNRPSACKTFRRCEIQKGRRAPRGYRARVVRRFARTGPPKPYSHCWWRAAASGDFPRHGLALSPNADEDRRSAQTSHR